MDDLCAIMSTFGRCVEESAFRYTLVEHSWLAGFESAGWATFVPAAAAISANLLGLITCCKAGGLPRNLPEKRARIGVHGEAIV